MPRPTLLALALMLATTPALALDDAALAGKVRERIEGDRTGACLAVAVIDERVARAIVCADPDAERPLAASTAFEIGSVSKTMNGTLLARLVADGQIALEDPIGKHLPEGTVVPEFEGQPIRIEHLVTHTAGLPALPAGFAPKNPANPYADLDEALLLAALGQVKLSAAPGSRWAYSNYGAMLLSWIVARTAGADYEGLLREQLFAPLGMKAFVAERPKGVEVATGHLPNGQPTSAWDFPVALSGVGGVRASLDDMVRYVSAQLAPPEDALGRAIATTQEEISQAGRTMGMGWMVAPLNGNAVHVHEGGTGGFSSFVAFDRDRGRGVVILSDTALTATGGLSGLGLHLIDERVPISGKRVAQAAPAELIDELAGEYRLGGGLKMTLRRKGDALEIQAEGQPAFEMGFDSAGDFYPLAFDALLRPQKTAAGRAFLWLQGGGAQPASRIDPNRPVLPALSDAQRAEYVGEYPLAPEFVMTVFEEEGVLKVQATGQIALELERSGEDLFAVPAAGAEFRFERDADQRIVALVLIQRGIEQRAPRR